MTGSASSLNASNAASVVLYEARRQRLARQRREVEDVPTGS
jgi:TrmH family RNA methyltransferase